MVRQRKLVSINQDLWENLNKLRQRYEQPFTAVIEGLANSCDLRELDKMFGYEFQKKKSK